MFDQHVPFGIRLKRGAGAGDVAEDKLEGGPRHHFEAFDCLARPGFEPAQEPQRGVRAFNPDPADRAIADSGDQPQARRRHDAQRAFGADQELGQIVTAIVLLERGKPVIDRAVRQDGLKPQHQLAHRAESQHLRSPRIGGNQPADRGRPLGTERKRKAHALVKRGIMEIAENHARLGDGNSACRIDAADRVHPAERKKQGIPLSGRRRAADHSRIAALRNKRDSGLARNRYNGGNLLRTGGGKQRLRGAMEQPAPIGQPRRQIVGVVAIALWSEQRLEA